MQRQLRADVGVNAQWPVAQARLANSETRVAIYAYAWGTVRWQKSLRQIVARGRFHAQKSPRDGKKS
jgi:hypothetical protein